MGDKTASRYLTDMQLPSKSHRPSEANHPARMSLVEAKVTRVNQFPAILRKQAAMWKKEWAMKKLLTSPIVLTA
ncbi:hypothetical protein GCM10025794_36850 [Massilia kyonggiensis]